MLSGRGVLDVGVCVPILGPFDPLAAPSNATPPSIVAMLPIAGEPGRDRVVCSVR